MRPHFLSVLSAVGYAFPLIDGAAHRARAPQPVPEDQSPLPNGTPAAYNRQIPPIPAAAIVTTGGNAEETDEMFGFPAPFDEEFLQMIRPQASQDASQTTQTPSRRVAQDVVVATETRAQRLERIKREVALGVYDTPERFEAAVDRMLEKLYA